MEMEIMELGSWEIGNWKLEIGGNWGIKVCKKVESRRPNISNNQIN